MSLVQSGAKHRLRYNHRGGEDADRQLLGVVIEERIPAHVGVRVLVDQPSALPQSDDAQRNATAFPAQPFVIESAPRPLVTSAGGTTLRRRSRTLTVLPTAAGVFTPVQVEPTWAPVGVSTVTVVDFNNGGGDTVDVTVVGGPAFTLTEGVDFAAAADNDTTAENIRVALAAVGVTATRVDNVLSITMPLAALATGDVTAWTVSLAPANLTPVIPAAGLAPEGIFDGFIPAWAEDVHGDPPTFKPFGHLMRVRWTGTAVSGATLFAAVSGTQDVFTGDLPTLLSAPAHLDLAPGSLVFTATVGAVTLTARDNGAGRIVGQETANSESVDGTIDYRTGELALTFSTAPDAASDILVDYEHTCGYRPLDVQLSWEALMAN